MDFFISVYKECMNILFLHRVRIGSAPPAKFTGPRALQKSIRVFANKPSEVVVNREIGTSFDSTIEEEENAS
jgi:hypothetical protein